MLPHLTLATQLENTRTMAMVNADVNTLNELLSDDLYYGHTAGYVDTKASFLEKIGSGMYSYFAVKAEIGEVHAIDKSGLVINGELTIEANASGEKKMFHAIYLGVWRLQAST